MAEVRVDAVQPGDVVQLDPDDLGWGPCFAVVESVHAWGVKADMYIPQERGQPVGIAPLRLAHGKYERVGKARWTIEIEIEATQVEGGEGG